METEALRKDLASVEPFFKEVRIGTPLLYHVSHFEKVVDILKKECPTKGEVVLAGHGTYTPSTASYAMLDYMFKDKGAIFPLVINTGLLQSTFFMYQSENKPNIISITFDQFLVYID